jgi:hypothetical protein
MTFKRLGLVIILPVLIFPMFLYGAGVKIIKVKGDVQVRKGLEEIWQPAKTGMILEDIDTILSLEGEVVLQLMQDMTFVLGRNAMLDIADLRIISKNDLFLLLMSNKVRKIESDSDRKGLKISNVTVVHAESKMTQMQNQGPANTGQIFERALNGAKALYNQNYYTNTVVKLHQILSRFPDTIDCGEIHYYLGHSFENLSETGQAIDAYKESLKRSSGCKVTFRNEAEEAIKRLNSTQK